MIVATGKSGRYRYYKCRTQIQKGTGCSGRTVPVKQLDNLIRQALGERVFIPERVQTMLAELRTRFGRDVAGETVKLSALGDDPLRALARWAFPSYADDAVDRVTRRVAVDSAGLPLLAVEICHAIALGLDLTATAGAWPEPLRTLDHTLPGALPDTVVAAIRVGFRRLSNNGQSALTAAAVLGEPASAVAIGRASSLAGDSLNNALDELEWQRWLVADGRGYCFVARIVRDVINRDMVTAGQRQRVLDAASP